MRQPARRRAANSSPAIARATSSNRCPIRARSPRAASAERSAFVTTPASGRTGATDRRAATRGVAGTRPRANGSDGGAPSGDDPDPVRPFDRAGETGARGPSRTCEGRRTGPRRSPTARATPSAPSPGDPVRGGRPRCRGPPWSPAGPSVARAPGPGRRSPRQRQGSRTAPGRAVAGRSAEPRRRPGCREGVP